MAIYNSPLLLLDGVNAQWLGMAGQMGQPKLGDLIAQTETDSEFERYPVLTDSGELSEWVDKMAITRLDDYIQLVQNRPYFKKYAVDRFTLGDTKKTLGTQLETYIQEQLAEWRNLPDKIISRLLLANPLAFDGTAFFANARPNLASAAAINNIVAGTGTTQAQISADLNNGMNAMMSWRRANGEPFNPDVKFTVVIPPNLHRQFHAIRTNEFLAAGVSNDLRDMFEIIVNPYLSAAAGSLNDWYIVNNATTYKFAVAQKDANNPPMWDMKDNRDEKEIHFFTSGRMGFGLINPLACVLVNNA